MDQFSLFIYLQAMFGTALMFFAIFFIARGETPKRYIRHLFIAAGLVAFGRIFNFLYTAYYGFNHFPQSSTELVLDIYALVISMGGLCWYFYTIVLVWKFHKKNLV